MNEHDTHAEVVEDGDLFDENARRLGVGEHAPARDSPPAGATSAARSNPTQRVSYPWAHGARRGERPAWIPVRLGDHGGRRVRSLQQQQPADKDQRWGWHVRLVGGLRQFVGFEAAYVGAARSIHTLGAAGNSPSLVSNGLEGTLRINVPVMLAVTLIEPYGFVGLGWSRYSIANYNSNTAVLSDFTSSADNVMTVPVGGGFAYGYKALLVDVRASYVPTYYNNLLQNTNGSGALNHWGVGGQLGYAF